MCEHALNSQFKMAQNLMHFNGIVHTNPIFAITFERGWDRPRDLTHWVTKLQLKQMAVV